MIDLFIECFLFFVCCFCLLFIWLLVLVDVLLFCFGIFKVECIWYKIYNFVDIYY